MAASSRLIELAESVLQNAKLLDAHFRDRNLPTPSFDPDGPVDFGLADAAPHLELARVGAIEAATELADLLQGPVAFLRPITAGISLHAISRWDIASKVPVGGETTFAALAAQCRVQEHDMRRLLRYAMAHHRLFREPRPGVVAHSRASRLLAEQPLLREGFWLLADEYFTTAPHAVSALERWGAAPNEPEHTAFSLARGIDVSAYDFMSSGDPAGREMGRRFALAMTSFARVPSGSPALPRAARLAEAYPWAALGRATVVDVGGSRGSDALLLARRFPDLSLVVEDLPGMIEGAEAAVPAELRGRVRFVPYSFFEPQTVAANAYLIKQCFHNWPDHYCVRILRNQVPALPKGARLIVCDSVVPPPGQMSLLDDRNVRAFDVMMLTNSAGREREEQDWHRIFKQADDRFRIKNIQSIYSKGDFGPATAVIEVVWEG